jgi:hypothetical protein
MENVFCEVGIKFLNISDMKFMLERLLILYSKVQCKVATIVD